jgi:hypothetical protein
MQDRSEKRRSAEENNTMEDKAEIKHEDMDDTDQSTFVVEQSFS